MSNNGGEVPGPSKKAKLISESIVDLQDVVKMLMKDTVFVENWKKFYHSLQLPSTKFLQWDRTFKSSSMTMEEILRDILGHWVMSHGKEAKVRRLYAALISKEFMSVAEDLKNHYELSSTIIQVPPSTYRTPSWTNSEIVGPILFELCETTDNFVGRKNELEMLDTFCNQKRNLIVVSGLGGVGKSELVRKFGIKFCNKVPGNCIWIQGESEESFKNSIKRLACRFLMFESDKDIIDIFMDVWYRILKQKGNSDNRLLLIVDNVDKRNSLVEKLIQVCKRLLDNILLLVVTTRNKSVLNNAGENIELKMLEPAEAVEMVRKGLGEWVSASDATKLCDSLGHFPLLVQQAISFIKQKRCQSLRRHFSVLEYLELFDKEKEKLLDYPLNVDYNYNSTTLRAWRVTLDDIKQMHGSNGLLALDILSMLPYFDANGVLLSTLVEFYQNANTLHKTDIEIKTSQRKLMSEDIERAVEIIQTYSMCRLDSVYDGDYVRQGGHLTAYKISSHRLIREFIRITNDFKMNKEIIRMLFFVYVYPYALDYQNVGKLGQSYKTFVAEMFIKYWKLGVPDYHVCSNDSEVYKKAMYEALEADGLYIHLALKFGISANVLLLCSGSILQNCHKIYQNVRRRYGLDHFLTKSIHKETGENICNDDGLPIDSVARLLGDMVDSACEPGYKLMTCFISIMVTLQKGRETTRERTEILMVLSECLTNSYHCNEIWFSLSALTMISNFFKRNDDINRYNQIQSDMLCLMEHPSELTGAWLIFRNSVCCLPFPLLQTLIFHNCNEKVDVGLFNKELDLIDSEGYEQVVQLVDIFLESKRICYLDLFAIVTITIDWLEDKGHPDVSLRYSNRFDLHLFNKSFLIKVIRTVKNFKTDDRNYDNPDHLLSLSTEILDSVKNGLTNRYEGIWSLGEIVKCLTKYSGVFADKCIELIDINEGLIHTDNEKDLFKRTMYGVVYDNVVKRRDVTISLFLRLQKYVMDVTILKSLLMSASVEEIVIIGNNIVETHKYGFIDKFNAFLGIKYVVKSFLNKSENVKALEILFRALNIEHCPLYDGNPKNVLFEKVQMTVIDSEVVNISIATFLYLVKCRDQDDPREFVNPSLLLLQILGILRHQQIPAKLLALSYEIYHFRGGWDKLYLCWTFIQILKCLVEMNRSELAERFLKNIIKQTDSNSEDFWHYKACWFLVFWTYYEAQSDGDSTSHRSKVDDCVFRLETFETSIKE